MRKRDRQGIETCQKIIRVRDQLGYPTACAPVEERFDRGAIPAAIMLKKMINCKNPNEGNPAAQPPLRQPRILPDIGQLGLPLRC